jgi:hypothetical protein
VSQSLARIFLRVGWVAVAIAAIATVVVASVVVPPIATSTVLVAVVALGVFVAARPCADRHPVTTASGSLVGGGG